MVVGVEPLHRHEPLHDRHDAADGLEIEPHDLVDVAVLHLDRDARPVLELRLVHLAERRAGERAPLEAREELVDRPAELGLDALLDLLEGPRRHLILQPLEPGAELLGEEVRHDGEELADLDEEALELEDRALDAPRVARCACGDAVVVPALRRRAATETERDDR